MTGLVCWLLIIGLIDLSRARRDATTWSRRVLLSILAAGAVLALAVSAHPTDGFGWTAWVSAAALGSGWVVLTGLALTDQNSVAALLAYLAMAVAVGLLLIAGSRTGQLGWWHHVLTQSAIGGGHTDQALADIAAMVFQISSANILIRMLLNLVGVPAQDNEKSLRGGRVLGPMERLLIVMLGLAGNLTGASVVVAAKALLRFPELRPARGHQPAGASDVTEYFLIGSFASWIVAFACLGFTTALS